MKDLAGFVATSDESQTAFVKQLFHHTVKQPILAYGPTRHDLQQSFAERDSLISVSCSSKSWPRVRPRRMLGAELPASRIEDLNSGEFSYGKR